MPRDARALARKQTEERLLNVAAVEFAAYGLAGARVERIAVAAHASKAQIYQYFGNKAALFDAVVQRFVVDVLEAVSIDAARLAEFAAELHDLYERSPHFGRLMAWRRLERGAPHLLVELILATNNSCLGSIEAAQREGNLSCHFSPVELLILVVTIASTWTYETLEVTAPFNGAMSPRRTRAIIVEAVNAVLALE
jgi:AcrR family transcriptional regulator